jgi:hypothetical protein
MVRHVAGGADPRMTSAVIREVLDGGDGTKLRELEDLYASELPGRWVVLSESWQGPGRDHLFMRALYVEKGTDTACLVSGDMNLACGARAEVDSIWMSVAEGSAISAEVLA